MSTFSRSVLKVNWDPLLVTKNEHFPKLCPEGRLGPPLVTKNEHFPKLCPEGQLGPLVIEKNEHFLKLCPEAEGQLGPPFSEEK